MEGKSEVFHAPLRAFSVIKHYYLITCPGSIATWEMPGMWNWIEPLITEVDSFRGLVFKLSDTLNADNTNKFAMLLWSLGKRRNEKLWNSMDETKATVCYRANSMLQDWT